jgi:hypothetical protein
MLVNLEEYENIGGNRSDEPNYETINDDEVYASIPGLIFLTSF